MMGTCKLCIFTEVCDANNVRDCSYYYPVDDIGYIDEMIEKERNEYYKEWFSYIGEYNDDIFF